MLSFCVWNSLINWDLEVTSKLIRDGVIYSDNPQMKRRKGGSMCASLPGTREFILGWLHGHRSRRCLWKGMGWLEEGTMMTHRSVDVQKSRNLLNKQGKESLGIRTLCPRPVPSSDSVGIVSLVLPRTVLPSIVMLPVCCAFLSLSDIWQESTWRQQCNQQDRTFRNVYPFKLVEPGDSTPQISPLDACLSFNQRTPWFARTLESLVPHTSVFAFSFKFLHF